MPVSANLELAPGRSFREIIMDDLQVLYYFGLNQSATIENPLGYINPILGYALNTLRGSGLILKKTGVSDWLTIYTLSQTEWPLRHGLNETLAGIILMIGMKGREEAPKE